MLTLKKSRLLNLINLFFLLSEHFFQLQFFVCYFFFSLAPVFSFLPALSGKEGEEEKLVAYDGECYFLSETFLSKFLWRKNYLFLIMSENVVFNRKKSPPMNDLRYEFEKDVLRKIFYKRFLKRMIFDYLMP